MQIDERTNVAHDPSIPQTKFAQRIPTVDLPPRWKTVIPESEVRGTGLVHQSTGKEVAKRLPHVVVKWSPHGDRFRRAKRIAKKKRKKTIFFFFRNLSHMLR